MTPDVSEFDNASIELWKQLIAQGDEQAFRKMFTAYAPRLAAFAFSFTRDREASIEIVDEIFVKIWRHKEKLPQILNITTYLYTATKNASLNFLSQKNREYSTEAFDFTDIGSGEDARPDQQLISSEIQAGIKKAVEGLPPRCKAIFKLVREDGLKYKEVAEILNISEKTVDAQMVIAVKRIGEAVEAHFDYFPARFQKK
ncbi:MAG: RNA polymerase sigma-70 factor [Agriterribacter sp.]